MTIELLKSEISRITDCTVLNELQECVAKVFNENLGRRENFMFRDYVDDVFFAIYFNDGRRNLQVKGSRAWEIFTNNDDAVRIDTISKDLFPVQEFLIKK